MQKPQVFSRKISSTRRIFEAENISGPADQTAHVSQPARLTIALNQLTSH